MPVVDVSPLEIARRARGLSQRDLARLAGVSRETISLIERGELPRVRTAHAIARALGEALDVLLPVNDDSPAGNGAVGKASGDGAQHESYRR